jgi:hypothetical protein
MLKTYLEYARTRMAVLATAPCEGPGWGQEWLFEVRDRPHPAAAVFPTLPGIDSAFAHATMTGEMHDRDRAMAEFKELNALLPGVAQAKLALGHLLVQTGRFREGYPLVRAASEAGLATCGEPGPLDWALSAYMTGRRKEGVDVYRRALAIYLRWAASPIPLLHRLL